MSLERAHNRQPSGGDERHAQSATRTRYHLHVNCFTAEPPPSIARLARDKIIGVTPFTIWRHGAAAPLWIATRKATTAREADQWFEKISADLVPDEVMCGYMETEAVNSDDIVRYGQQAYDARESFPLARLAARDAARWADIHVFRAADAPRDELDLRLEASGFYEVVNKKERIWTLLVGDLAAGVSAFRALKDYFATARGILKLELEVVRKLQPFPNSYAFAPVYFQD